MKKVIQYIVLLWLVCGLVIVGTTMMNGRVESWQEYEKWQEAHVVELVRFNTERAEQSETNAKGK